MNRTKKISSQLVAYTVFLILAITVTACSSSIVGEQKNSVADTANITEDNIIITFALSRWDKELYEPLAEEFHKQNPLITVQFVDTNNLVGERTDPSQNYSGALASAADTSLIVGPFVDQAGTYFRDLQSLMDADPNFNKDDFLPGLLETCQDSEGNMLGIPFSAYVNVIYFEKEAFDKAGLPFPVPGWTYDDFRRYVTLLANKESNSIKYGYADPTYLSDSILAPLIDAQLAEQNGELDARALQAALQWYFDLIKEKAIYPIRATGGNGGSRERDEWNASFRSGDRPVMWAGNLAERMPGMESVPSENDPFAGMAIMEDGIAPFPVSTDRSISKTTPVRTQCITISAGSAHPQAAWAWVNFLSFNQGLARTRTPAAELAQVPARQSVANTTGYWQKLPAGAELVLRYALEHAWSGSFYPQAFNAVEKAISTAQSGKSDFVSALSDARTEFVATPQPIHGSIAVATPEPTQSLLAETANIRFFSTISNIEEEQAIRNSIDAFNHEHPDIVVKLFTDFNLPDSGIEDMPAYLDENYDCYNWYRSRWSQRPDRLLSLNPLVQAEGDVFLQDFYPEQVDAYRYEGELYGLPAASQPRLMSYNKGLLAKRGLNSPSVDWTFDDFIQLSTAAASTLDSDKSYGFLYNPWEDILFAGRGIEWSSLTTEPPIPKFSEPEVIRTLEWLSGLDKDGVFLTQRGDNFETVNQVMISGQVAFWISQAGGNDSWYFTSTGGPSFETGVVPMPTVEGHDLLTWAVERGYFISRQAENPQACWTLIKFISEQPGVYPGVPARRSVAESTAWEALVGRENAAIFRLSLSRAQQSEDIEENSPISGPLFDWQREAIVAVINGENPAQATTEAQSKAEAYLACVAAEDRSSLNEKELQEKVNACAKQADPKGNWP